jgi:Na+/H+ antiporter NhaC
VDTVRRSSRRPSWGLIVAVGTAAPLGLALESLLRTALLPSAFEEVRDLFRESLTFAAWIAVLLSVVFALLGFLANRSRARSAEARLTATATQAERDRVISEAYLLGTSIAQLPAIFATLLFTFGAELLPVLVALGVSTIAIAIQSIAP